MKFSKYIFPIFTLAILLLSCKDDFLEEKPYDFLAPENFYTNKADAIAAVNSVYDALHGGNDLYGRHLWMMVDFPSEQMTNNRDGGYRGELDKLIWDPTNQAVEEVWRGCYVGINRANTVLKRVPEIEDIDDATQQRVLAEAQFLRAFYYFTLIRLYGNVPLITEPTNGLNDLQVSNEGTADAVWQLIIDDLKAAEAVLPVSYTGKDIGRATQGAAKSLLAKVYLQRSGLGVANEWQMAADKAKEVIDAGTYGLYENYGDNFREATENGKESIFAVQYASNIGEGNNLGAMTGPRGGKMLNIDQWSSATGEPEFFNTFYANDLRMPATWILEYTRVDNGKVEKYGESSVMPLPHTRKYVSLGAPATGDFGLNYNILRYADVLLMHSEALNMAGGPSEAAVFGINEVRKRAGLPLLDPNNLSLEQLNEIRAKGNLPLIPASASPQEILRQYIIQERAWELCFEAQAYFDYQRQRVLEERVQAVGHADVSAHRYLYPIPQREMDINPLLKQNTGY